MAMAKGLVAIAMTVIVVNPTAAAPRQDCAAAESLLRQIDRVPSVADRNQLRTRLHLLQQAAARCDRLAIQMRLGQTYLDLDRPEDALRAFDAAAGLSATDRQRALVTYRKAAVLYRLGRLPESQAALDAAIEWTAGDVPGELLELRLILDRALSARIVSADAMQRTLGAARSFGTLPSLNVYIGFDTDQDIPNPAGMRQLRELAHALEWAAGPRERVLVAGHTDRRGRCAYNQDLSERRAGNVARLLAVRQPALAGRLQAQGFGEQALRYRGNSSEDHRLNRRVEVTLIPMDDGALPTGAGHSASSASRRIRLQYPQQGCTEQ